MQAEYGTITPGENAARVVDVPISTNGTDRVSASARTFMVGKNESRIAEHIKNQPKQDEMGEPLTMSQFGPFTGSK